jgi:hypothetical protein
LLCQVNKVELNAEHIKVNKNKPEADTKENQQFIEMMPWDQQGCKERMEEINGHIKAVSESVRAQPLLEAALL